MACFEASFPFAIDAVSGTIDVRAPLLDTFLAFSSKAFVEKYPSLNRGAGAGAGAGAAIALRLEALERFLVIVRDGPLVVCRKHDIQTVERPLGLKALTTGYRIIIA